MARPRSSISTIRPSSIRAIRSPKWKTRLSCVTTTTARSGRTAACAEQLHHGQAGLVVERGGRLVADQQAAARAPAPGRSPPAAAGRRRAGLGRLSIFLPIPSESRTRRHAGPPARRPAGDDQRDRRVLGGRQGGQEVVLLEDKADRPGPEPRLLRRSLIAVIVWPKIATSPSSRSRMPAMTDKQRRLAAARKGRRSSSSGPCTRPSRPRAAPGPAGRRRRSAWPHRGSGRRSSPRSRPDRPPRRTRRLRRRIST